MNLGNIKVPVIIAGEGLELPRVSPTDLNMKAGDLANNLLTSGSQISNSGFRPTSNRVKLNSNRTGNWGTSL